MIPILKAAACDFKLFGKIEKIFSTYGFVVTADGQRYFFHFGTCITKPEFFRVGDDVEFVLGEDTKTHRVHAQKLYKCTNPPPAASRSHHLFSYIPIQIDPSPSSAAAFPISLAPQHSPPLSVLPAQLLTKTSLNDQENLAKALLQLQQHPSVSVQCTGLVVSLPNSTGTIRGTIACEIAGNPTFIRYSTNDIKYPLEKTMIVYGAKVNFTAVWHSQTGTWTAKEVTTCHENVVCELGTIPSAADFCAGGGFSPQHTDDGGSGQAFSPVSTTSVGSTTTNSNNDLVNLKRVNSQQQQQQICDALQNNKREQQMDWDDFGLFTQTRPLMQIGNLQNGTNGTLFSSSNGNAFDKAREAWFSVSGE